MVNASEHDDPFFRNRAAKRWMDSLHVEREPLLPLPTTARRVLETATVKAGKSEGRRASVFCNRSARTGRWKPNATETLSRSSGLNENRNPG